MGLKRLIAIQSVCVIMGFGVFFAFILAAAVSNGGKITLDMTLFNEMWIEYWLMMATVAVFPWGIWFLTKE